MKKRIFSLLLVLTMVLGLIPATAFAASATITPSNENTGKICNVFFYDGETLYAAQQIASGDYSTEPQPPVQPEKSFKGWFTEDGEYFDFSTPITEDLTLYAIFGYGVILHFGEDPIGGQIVEEGKCAVKPDDPAQEGKVFLGWFTAFTGGKLFDFDTPITEEVKLYARFVDENLRFTVNFYHGAELFMSDSVPAGGYTTEPRIPPVEGNKSFKGWFTEDGEYFDFSTPITEDVDLYAIFGYGVILHFGEDPIGGQIVEEGKCAVKPDDPAQEGKVFLGWFTAFTGGELFDFDTPITGEVKLYARFLDENFRFTVNYYHGAELVMSDSVPVGGYTTEPRIPPVEANKSFKGWFTEDGEYFDFSTPITEDVDLYAIFGYGVILHFGEDPIGGQIVEEGKCAVKPDDPAQEGKVFLGWFTAFTGGELFDFDTPITGEVKLYARFVDENAFVKGDVDGNSELSMDDAIYLLFHVNFKDSYPICQAANFDGKGGVDMDDAIYLLFHVNFKDAYPLH